MFVVVVTVIILDYFICGLIILVLFVRLKLLVTLGPSVDILGIPVILFRLNLTIICAFGCVLAIVVRSKLAALARLI